MKRRERYAMVVMFFVTLFLGTTLAQGQDRHHDRFDDHDRQVARDWYRGHHEAFRHDEGRYWHQEWEPNLREGFVLTPEIRAGIRPVPADLRARFGPLPAGYRYVIIGDHVCVIDRGYRIHDILHFELNF